ncbi:bifunctional riboflavin kinase/FAD synthetase [Anaerosacchariphilus sp. NSJ-68]|uniref:Riboflavin biosynthesis protein n=2 Tax=Lachnospiraceae TaxID=186803 RepID=A0A923LCI6_9FIRM|nr:MULTISPECIES: bifunctional riboflavin kinase/FAD synthetase [Lachnospiraceae]MBC5659773.1 bifunctional riboflavin kinase/FAD synthetase [Anaerosacchariphilus hominis]MBC5697439.1 bifunctional riboflavin kinase/FAD synthetase [Roseburia difficilis]
MILITGTTEFQTEEATAISLGKFDGIHQGHQLLVDRILKKKEEGLKSLIFTFDFGERPTLLLPEERRELLSRQGVDYLVECPFVDAVSHMEAENFVREILVKRLHVKYLAVGTDFHFGHNRKGSYRLLEEMSGECGFQVEVVEKACYQGEEISSSRIRRELEQGHMELVNQLLGYSYGVSGEVLHGRQIGRTLGLPTINLQPEARKLLPPNGVYATRTRIAGETFEGITNIGYKPTVGGETRKGVETYLFDLDRNLYGEQVTVSFYGFERPESKFASLEALKARIEQDVLWGRTYFGDGMEG